MQWGSSASQGLFYTTLNYIALFPAARFVWNTANMDECPVICWASLLRWLARGSGLERPGETTNISIAI